VTIKGNGSLSPHARLVEKGSVPRVGNEPRLAKGMMGQRKKIWYMNNKDGTLHRTQA